MHDEMKFGSGEEELKPGGGGGGEDELKPGGGGFGTKFTFTIPAGWSGMMLLTPTGAGLSITVEEEFKDGGGGGGEDELKPGGGGGGEDELKPGGGKPKRHRSSGRRHSGRG